MCKRKQAAWHERDATRQTGGRKQRQEVGRANRFENQAAGEGEGGINARHSQALNQEKGRRVGE